MGSLAPISIAVIGAGMIGSKHVSFVANSPEATLAAIVDPTPVGETIANQYGCPCFRDVQSLLDSTCKVTAAIVCTPNESHVSISKQLAAEGIHLLIEKPVSTSVEDGKDLLRYCKEQRVRVCVGHHRRFHPSIGAAKSALDSDAIGDIIGLSGLWTVLKPEPYFEGGGKWRAGEAGGVVLINLIHELDLLQYMLGPIVRVFAEEAPSTRQNIAEEGAAITLRFETGVVGSFLALDNTPSPFSIEKGTGENPIFPFTGKDCYRFFGRKGVLSAPDGKLWLPENLEKGWHSQTIERQLEFEAGEVYEKQLQNFVGVIRGDQEPVCSGEAGLAAVAACVAVRRSLVEGRPVEVGLGSL